MPLKFLFAGGGTGGHLFPGIAIAREILKMKPDSRIHFAGTERGIEATEVPKQGFTLHLISIAGFKRGFSIHNILENLKFPFRLKQSIDESYRLLDQEEPDVVIGTGGYVSAPVVYAAQRWGIPTIIQEQNASLGISTKFLARNADEVHLSFESSKKLLNREGVFVSGNPTRDFKLIEKSEARKKIGLLPERPTLFAFGGSLGARSLNRFIEANLDRFLNENNLIWQTGKLEFESIIKRIGERQHLWVNRFVDEMDVAYSAADLVLCRAGASTLAELARIGKPSILIPYPFAANNHQFHNAESFTEKGAAELIVDANLTSEESVVKIESLLKNDSKLSAMSKAVQTFAKPNAAHEIAKHAIAYAQVFKDELIKEGELDEKP
ncbi:MAG: undecaprenyldiphospho-muramoylpentapeptide beta-N-acetylglucosaminyltransferase [Chloroherpetonaceae bacterium]|nr:undecaprenyldiphospho-muramoylpentapeptide beta-N-acetylglucosaminyltransferase [Chloroherpetonaceae bacterium]